MTDTDKLKRLAEAMTDRGLFGIKFDAEECRKYGQAILALIAENERLKAEIEDRRKINGD